MSIVILLATHKVIQLNVSVDEASFFMKQFNPVEHLQSNPNSCRQSKLLSSTTLLQLQNICAKKLRDYVVPLNNLVPPRVFQPQKTWRHIA